MINSPFFVRLLVGAAVATTLIFAPLTASTADLQFSGFLKDYSKLQPRNGNPELLAWRADADELRAYRSFIVERPYIYLRMTPQARKLAIHPDEFRELTDYLRNAIINALEPEYKVQRSAGKNVARMRIAIAEVKASASGDTASVVSRGDLSVSKAVLEIEITDSVSEERLAAIVDNRVGSVPAGASHEDRWQHTKAAFRRLAEGFRTALDDLHSKN